MIDRTVRSVILRRLEAYPAVLLVGPRQAGKTTLAQAIGSHYFDLEHEPDRLRLDLEWDRLLADDSIGAPGAPVVFDEAQSWPELFPRLRSAIDRDRGRRGRFFLLGSVSPALMRHVSQSLAGRLSIVELSPFLRVEVPAIPLDRLWLCGGYPEGGVLDETRFAQWQRDYLDLLVQRDLPNWGLPATPQVTQRLARMLAGVHGQLWNASQIASGMGLTYATVNKYLDYLEGAFLTRRLQPYSANIKKRLVKNPKVYWRDSGLYHALLHTETIDELMVRPWVGQSWEGFVVEQILGALGAAGETADAYFFRTSDRHEIDLVLQWRGELWAIEIKLTAQPTVEDLNRLDKVADMIGAGRRVLISRAAEVSGDDRRLSCSLEPFLASIRCPS